MYSFGSPWAEEIAAESTKEEYQNATIRLWDEAAATLISEYDIETNTGPIYEEGSGDIYEGRARIIGVRWGVFHGGEAQANAMTEKAIRVQVPFNAVGRVRKGVKVFIEQCDRNPVLEDLIFTVSSDLQGSMSAARTFECSLDGDVEKA